MFTNDRISVLICFVVVCISCTNGFFFNWGSEPPRVKVQDQYPYHSYYHQRLVQSRPYQYPSSEAQPVPAIPIQVPLSAQLSPIPNVQNVQLVPCLCPITADGVELEGAQPTNVYLNQIKPPIKTN